MSSQRARWLVLAPETWRADLLRIVLGVIAGFGGVVCVPSVFFALRIGKTPVAALDTAALAAVFALAYFRRIPERLRAAGTGLVMYALGAGLMVEVGPISQIYLFGFSLLTALLLGARWGLATVVLNALTMMAIGYAGVAAPSMLASQGKWSPGEWAVTTSNFVFVNASLVLAMGLVINALETALGRAVAAREALEHERRELVKLNESLGQEMSERVRSDEARKLVEARHSKLEEQFRQAQKMETVGSLAGGVAHDFNNLMSIVLSYSEMLADGLKNDDPMLADLHEIRDAGLRAVDLTRQLLAFSRQQVLAPKIVDLGNIVGGMEKMLGRSSRSS
jgi:signal transduction histidine kinase